MDFFRNITRRKLMALILVIGSVITLGLLGAFAAPPLFY